MLKPETLSHDIENHFARYTTRKAYHWMIFLLDTIRLRFALETPEALSSARFSPTTPSPQHHLAP
ncbi:hypothetical protein Hypma_014446 [Hypsizygus marmoreus]|uniref:Uncharacterized protein n=1 Tax=Hypsizygus marmoreus TaxID=39966 RepID=A0A369JEZ2_HYPMA|nr:hypothetical protein Hypma_014446 [Hypsizygus marmoreus]